MTDSRDPLTHLDDEGRPAMVDVTGKAETLRRAVASGRLRMERSTLKAILEGRTEKGDPLQVARIAGLQAGKRTADLIPLCHALPGASIDVQLTPSPELPGIVVRAEARYRGRTGVEMEALTAVSVAALTIYDMCKSVSKEIAITDTQLLAKTGGQSGDYRRTS